MFTEQINVFNRSDASHLQEHQTASQHSNRIAYRKETARKEPNNRPYLDSFFKSTPHITPLLLTDKDNLTRRKTPPRSNSSEMADGKNDARALRILEIMGDFQTLQRHIQTHVNRRENQAPDAASAALPGYAVLARCATNARIILAMNFNPGVTPGGVAQTEAQKAILQRIVLDASTRRFQAHKIYLQAAAGTRWVTLRSQVLQQVSRTDPRREAALRTVDDKLTQEIRAITDQHVVSDLRTNDVRKGYWVDEDPTLERMLAWLRSQR